MKLLALAALSIFAATAPAGVAVETYGTSGPPIAVAGVPVSRAPFRGDLFADILTTDINASGATGVFSSAVSVRQIGMGWATWSHGYTGNVFYTNGVTTLTITMSPNIFAFQFYAEPNPFGVWNMTASGSDGSLTTSATQSVEGSAGASGWAFYGTDGAYLESVTLSSDIDFAIGEFAAVDSPAPGGLAALGLASLVAIRRRR